MMISIQQSRKEKQTIESKVLQIHFLDCNDLRKEIFFQWKSSVVMSPQVLANVEISLQSYILKQQCLSVCVGSAWKILLVTARSLWSWYIKANVVSVCLFKS
jgi:hypothetical protein